jgi:hypothetical protein
MYLVAFYAEDEKECDETSLNVNGSTIIDSLDEIEVAVEEQYQSSYFPMCSQIFELKHIGEVITQEVVQSKIKLNSK